MKIKTSELTDAALDWAVLEAQKPELAHPERGRISCFGPLFGKGYMYPSWGTRKYPPSTDWAQGGPIIERERISIIDSDSGEEWNAMYRFTLVADDEYWSGPTPLIAAMRCFVATKLGDELEIPDCLLEGSC